MNYLILQPKPPLDEAVGFLWLYDGYQPPHELERVLPSGTVELVINLEDGELRVGDPSDPVSSQRFRGPLVAGVQRRHFIIDTRQQRVIMGAHLKPGGAWRLGLPAHELSDTHVTLEDIVGSTAGHLKEALLNVADGWSRLRMLEAFLLRRLTREFHSAVAWALHQFDAYPDRISIGTLAEESGLSHRRFNELFTREVGIQPKGFARIRRFQSALAEVFEAREMDWCDLAESMGYADQAHFIREFREFTGLTPTAYMSLRGAEMNHVPLEERHQICPVVDDG